MDTETCFKYTPASIIGIFNNSINVSEEKKLIEVEGVYQKQNSREYNECFYDRLKDNNSDKSLTLIVPKSIRDILQDNYVYSYVGFVSRRVQDNGNIQINFTVVRISSTEIVPNDEDELKVLDSRIKKSLKKYKSFHYKIESKLFGGYKPRLAIIMGHNAIIKDDIINALGKEADNFVIDEYRTNLGSKDDIMNKIGSLDITENYDSIVIARGGGSGLELFNSPDIIDFLSGLKTVLVTAIGHAADYSFLQSISDYNFDTPTALGGYLKSTSEKIMSLYSNLYKELDALKEQIKVEQENKVKIQNEIKQCSFELQNARLESASRLYKIRSLKASVFMIVAAAIVIIGLAIYFLK